MNSSNPNEPNSNHRRPFVGISQLSQVTLEGPYRHTYELASLTCAGETVWKLRKLSMLHEFLALAQVSRRIRPMVTDLSGDLRIFFQMDTPVPVLPDSGGDLKIEQKAILSLRLREIVLRQAIPGSSCVQIHAPAAVFLPNVAPAHDDRLPEGMGQPLCLGVSLSPSISCKEIVLRSYGALSGQSIQLDASHPAGVMNLVAARWWLENRHRLPLTRAPFIDFDEPSMPS